MTREYRVVWEIDVEADDEIAAAREAVTIMKRPYADSIAHVFSVRTQGPNGEATAAKLVDLDELDGKDTA